MSSAMIQTDAELTPLHPNHLKVTRIVAALCTVPLVIGSIVLEVADVAPLGVFVVPAVLIAAGIIFRVPLRRYQARGYDVGGDRLRVVRGIWFHSDTVVPFGRVQHIDVDQGPLQRAYDIATITVHTAGTHNASVHLPGLLNEDALAMREQIRAHIKQEAV